MTISSLKNRLISATGGGTRCFFLFVHHSQGAIEEDRVPVTNESIDPEKPDTSQGEATEKSGRDVT